ncbi:hypothetical protein BRD17_02225 [Halobacteriales archaeon SW_7_68_16]|nr:MAG: hypothetical protein BRD17_02225 [Halobacteriales archaeon SW_7_68_16]
MTRRDQRIRDELEESNDGQCIVPWCSGEAAASHAIVDRQIREGGDDHPANRVAVCDTHRRYAEQDAIPPQAFWLWAGIDDPPLPAGLDTSDVDRRGEPFGTPRKGAERRYIKYRSTRHLLPLYREDATTAAGRTEHDDTELGTVEPFVGRPLVVTHKMDGSNCTLVGDPQQPVRARNGSEPIETMRPLYRPGGMYWTQTVNQKLPDRLQVFGEWLWAKHAIHYGCDCDDPCSDRGPPLTDLVDCDDERAYFQVFGVFDTELNLWLSWPETVTVAETLGFPTVPVIDAEDDADPATFDTPREARRRLADYARDVIAEGGEGIVVRPKFPYHYGQFPRRIGKYVRENHVDDESHWRRKRRTRNRL